MWSSVQRLLQLAIVLLLFDQAAYAVNPAQWTIVEELRQSDSIKTWTSPTAVDLNKMVWQYNYEITKVTGTVNVPILGDITEDITASLPDDQRMGFGETQGLPAVLIDDVLTEPESGTSVDVSVEVDNMGFGRAVFSNIMLGSVNVPLFGERPIQRINIEASIEITGYEFGDYNRDGSVDAADYVVWRKTLGQTGAGLAADGNGNNDVDAEDYAVWRGHFGTSVGGGNSHHAAVPEPESLAIVVLAIIAAWIRFRPTMAHRMAFQH